MRVTPVAVTLLILLLCLNPGCSKDQEQTEVDATISDAESTSIVDKQQKPQDPKNRFSLTANKGITIDGFDRNYVFDTVKVVNPGSSMLHVSNLQVVKNHILWLKREITYNGRKGPNNIAIEYKRFLSVDEYVIVDKTENLDFYIDDPDTVTTLKFGDAEEPSFILEVTLDGSELYYKVIGDWVSPE